MRKYIFFVILKILFLHNVLLLSNVSTPLLILSYPVGAKINSMGNCYNSLGFDIFTVGLNSAVIGYLDKKNFGMTTALMYENTILGYLAYLQPTLDLGNFAVNFLYFNSFAAKETDEYNRITGREFSYSNTLSCLGWGKELIIKKLYMGVNIKTLFETIDTYNRTFLTSGLGVIYRLSQKIDLATSINNIISLKLTSTEDIIPLDINFGIGIRPFDKLNFGIDFGKNTSGLQLLDRYSFGVSWSPFRTVSIRAGKNKQETSFGVGFVWRNMNVDYAMVLQEYLGFSHRISLDFKFGKTLEEIWADKLKELPATDELEVVEIKLKTEEERRRYFYSLFNEAVKQYTLGNFKQAVNNLNKAKEIDPEATDINIYLERINLIIPLYPNISAKDKITSLLLRGVNYYINGDNTSAVKVINYALSLSPNDTQIARLLNKIEEKTGVRAEKVESPAGTTIVDKLHNDSLIAFRKRDYATAVKLCEEILLLEPEDTLAYKRLGSAFYAMGEKDKAIQMWQQVLRLDPKDEKLKSMLENIGK
ncbi:MAG: tetratricopeptide repeat protein [Endomicrobia bacterium]|nr:tetratricopeptide repeat protein [Endomicrobiia bacterium]